jgi:hypothetical protein
MVITNKKRKIVSELLNGVKGKDFIGYVLQVIETTIKSEFKKLTDTDRSKAYSYDLGALRNDFLGLLAIKRMGGASGDLELDELTKVLFGNDDNGLMMKIMPSSDLAYSITDYDMKYMFFIKDHKDRFTMDDLAQTASENIKKLSKEPWAKIITPELEVLVKNFMNVVWNNGSIGANNRFRDTHYEIRDALIAFDAIRSDGAPLLITDISEESAYEFFEKNPKLDFAKNEMRSFSGLAGSPFKSIFDKKKDADLSMEF